MLNYTCLHFNDLDASELFDALSLRQEVFVVEQNCAYQDADQYDKLSWHVLGQDYEDQMLAYARIIPPEVMAKESIMIGRVVTSPIIRRSGEGKILMEHSIEFAYSLFGRRQVEVSAQTYLIHFYKSLGFESKGESYLEDGIPHVKMVLKS